MSADNPIRRRDLLRLILASGALAALPGVAAITACDSDSAAAVASARRLAETVANEDSVRKLGKRSLATTGESSISAQLKRAFPENSDIEKTISASSPEQVRILFVEQHRKDIEAGRVVDVDGWVLSNTEARLYAVVALAYRWSNIFGLEIGSAKRQFWVAA